jgi:predicted transcriptional regulator
MPRLERLSKRLLGGIWAYEIYRALTELFETKAEVEVSDVRALTAIPEKDVSIVSKQLDRLADFGLLTRLNYRGRFRRVEDQFWTFVADLVRAWEAQPPTPPPPT